jgi:hypothetical protein
MKKSKREPTQVDVEKAMALECRGWILDAARATATHPKLQWPWPVGDALRLEEERDRNDLKALRLLGKLNK